MSKVCYIPLKGVDDVIAAHLGWKPTANFNPAYRVATLRGMYDEVHEKNPLDTSDPAKAAQALASFRREIARGNNIAMNSVGTNLHASYLQLRRSFTAEERFNRVNMLASMFSRWIDRMKAADPSKSRTQFVEGFIKDGKPVAGEFKIFEMMYSELIDRQAHYMSLGTQDGREKAAKINQILSNWAPLTAFVRMKLRDTEGVKLGNALEWADETNSDNFGDNNMGELFDMSESTRESWQETNDMRSSFGSVGKNVRRLISCLPLYKEGKDGKVEVQYDDLGHPIMLDPVKVHQALMEDLRGITSEDQMMRAFFTKDGSLKHEWLKPIVQTLRTNNQLRTQFFVDFKKNFQPYSILVEDKDPANKGLKVFKTKLLNRVENLLGGEFMTRVQLGTPVNEMNSVFDKNGNVNWQNLQKVRSLITEWLNPGPMKVSKWYNPKTTRAEKRAFLLETSEALGMPVDADTIDSIMGTPKDLKEYLNNLKQALVYGIEGNLTKEVADKLTAGDYSISKRSYKSLLTAQNSSKGSLREKIDKMLTLITKNREGLRLESRVRHKNSKGKGVTLFSDINPSYMGDKLELIKSYVEANDKDGLKKFLEDHYLCSSYFRDSKGTVLNVWLDELLKCCDKKGPELSETFAAQFDYMRALGSADINFENFTGKQHMVDMLTRFFSDKQISSNAETALYPVFILGDSGVSKYIRAKMYEANDILDGMYKVWRQEKRRMMLTEAANRLLEEGGYKGIDNFSKRKVEVKRDANGKVIDVVGEYTMLPFLNEPKYAKLLGGQSEAEVKAAIQAYMADALVRFKQSLNNMGLLETKQVKVRDPKTGKYSDMYRYVHLPKNITPANLDKELARFYWNTKFATIQQLQMMTVDTAFYKGTKDLQKRYKEIHAPGQVLSLTALDRDGKRYSEDGIERCIYFDDIELSSADTNPKFLAAVKARLREGAWKKYLENTLTDGQGHRTLRSYRKVMGMAGQWTDEMENAFREIEGIRSRYQKGKIPAEELKRIADLAVVFQPIKPYMFTHEVLAVNNTDKLFIPVQHKYAEAVLIPELLPYGSKLRDIAYYMDENNIDLVCSTKVVKVGCFGSTSIKGVKNAEELNAALAKGYVHQLSYADYRIQSNVPDHVQSARLFGTQVRKLIMAGVKMDRFDDGHYASYIDSEFINLGGKHGNVRMNGRNLISFYNSLIVANIMDSFDKFSKSTGNIEELSKQLIQAVINNSRESMDNLLAYGIEDDDFAVPLFEAGLEHDAASMLLSIFRKMVNKQTIQGNPLVQVSAMGISGYAEDGDLQYVTDDNGNILYAECEIPWDLSYVEKDENGHDRVVNLDFNDYCNEDGTLKLGKDGVPLIEKKLPGVTSMVAYRIPTERDYSMINLRVKRFSQKTAGGTIKVPAEGTTIAGFDFDVDKLYLMRREYKSISPEARYSKKDAYDIFANIYSERPDIESALIAARKKYGKENDPLHTFWDYMLADNPSLASDSNYNKDILFRKSAEKLGITPKVTDQVEFEEYDFTKSPLENTKAARNNMLIHLIQQRLMDPETFEQRYTPGGFANASKSARIMRELLFGDLSGIVKNGEVDFAALDARAARKDLDPEPNYDPSDPMTIITYNQQNQVAGKLIGIFANQNTNHAFASLMSSFKLAVPISFAGHSYGDGIVSDFLNPPTGVDVDLNVAELLSASVDAVKDPVLNFMNLNTITADAGAILARIGYTTQEIGILFNQPIIKELCDYCLNNGVSIEIALRDVKSSYLTVEGVKAASSTSPSDFTIEKLASHIIKDRTSREAGNNAMENADFISEQLKVLELFNNITTIASQVSQFVTSTKFTASNAVGSTFGDLYAQQMRVNKYLQEVESNEGIIMEVTDMIHTPLNNNPTLLNMSKEEYFDSLIDNPFAYEQAMFDANRKALRHLTKYFPYDNSCYSKARGMLASLTKSGTLDADTINSLHSDMMVYLLANEEHSDFNGELPKLGTGHTNPDGTAPTVREYYTKYFASDMFRELEANPALKELAIFKYMVFNANEQGDVRMNVQGIGGLAPFQKDEIRESWSDLSRTNPLIARDLFLYNFYKLGFQFGPSAFMNLAPTEVKQSLRVPSSNPRTDVLLSEDGSSFVMYRGYATNTGSKAKDLDDTVKGSAVDYIDPSFEAGYHFTEEEDATMYGQVHAVRYTESGKEGYTPQVSKFYLSKDTKYKKYKDIIDANRHKDEWGDIDAIILENGTLGDGQFEVIVKKGSKDKVIFADEERSYVQFLKDVRDDKIQYDPTDFAIQYMLNHPDNEKLVFNADKSKTARKIVSELAFNSAKEARSNFTIDIAKRGDDAGLFLLKSPTKKDPTAIFRPVISIKGALFVAQSGGLNFNQTEGTTMTYVKMDQQGSKGVSLRYNGSTPVASVLDVASETEQEPLGNSSQEPGPAPVAFDREAAITEIATEMAKALENIGYKDEMGESISAQSLIEGLRGASDAELQSQIEDIRKACRKDGILLMDSEGNLLQGC